MQSWTRTRSSQNDSKPSFYPFQATGLCASKPSWEPGRGWMAAIAIGLKSFSMLPGRSQSISVRWWK